MKIGICDDEKEIRELLGEKVQTYCPEAELLYYPSGEALLLGIVPDILLLDIKMQGIDGMETARELRRKNRKVVLVFVTAVEEYVFEAFDVEAYHYLVKPFTDEKFETVLKQAVRKWEETMLQMECGQKYLMIMAQGMHRKVFLEDIIYAEVFNRKILLHKMDEDIEYYGRMTELENLAGDDFFRSHRAYLVNLKYVQKYDASMIYLEKGTALMSKHNYPMFVKKYLRYNRMQRK